MNITSNNIVGRLQGQVTGAGGDPFRSLPQGMGHSSPPAQKAPLIFAPAPGAQTHLQGGFGTQGWRACAPPPPDDELKKNEGNAETGTDVKGKAPKKWDSSRYMCPHNRRKYLCRDCGGSQVCEHDKVCRKIEREIRSPRTDNIRRIHAHR